VEPAHERGGDPAALEGRLHGHSPDVQVAGREQHPGGRDRAGVDPGEDAAAVAQVVGDALHALAERAARWVEVGLRGERRLGERVDDGRVVVGAPADPNPDHPPRPRSPVRPRHPEPVVV